MSQDDSSAEDVAGLFRKFGGDAHAYKEFTAPEADAQAANSWPLLSGAPMDRTPVTPPAPSITSPPAPRAAAPKPSPAPLSSAAAAPFAPTATSSREASELQNLFARLAQPQHRAPPPGPMSRWRRPT